MVYLGNFILGLITVVELLKLSRKRCTIFLVTIASWGLWFSSIILHWLYIRLVGDRISNREVVLGVALLQRSWWDQRIARVYVSRVCLAFWDDSVGLFWICHSLLVCHDDLILVLCNYSVAHALLIIIIWIINWISNLLARLFILTIQKRRLICFTFWDYLKCKSFESWF